MSNLSIVIPCWEAYGRGDNYLRNLLHALSHQTVKDFSVCISDQSNNDKLFEVCEEYADQLHIIYYKNTDKSGFVSNVNTAIELGEEVNSEIIKIIFQDDFILTSTVIEETYLQLSKSTQQWAVCGFAHTVDEGKHITMQKFLHGMIT